MDDQCGRIPRIQIFDHTENAAITLLRLAARLTIDVVEHIMHHCHAMPIQACVRRHRMRHTRHPAWRALRRGLTATLDTRDFDLLQRNERVRSEWRSEPESWVHTLTHGDENAVRDIVTEVATGLWQAPRSHRLR